jgi:serine phosphatase RsbU (regulator of sigma subunit)
MDSTRTKRPGITDGILAGPSAARHLRELESELENFHEIASHLKPEPGEVPHVRGFDIYGETIPLNGGVGGDHLIYLDFKQRYDLDARIARALEQERPDIAANLTDCRGRAGIVLADVAGHRITDALLAAMLHQAFILGAGYELDIFGEVTKSLFENLNTRFYKSSAVRKFITMIYGEVIEDGRFRFISAAHPAPMLFSGRHGRFVDLGAENSFTCPPLGTMPSRFEIDRTRFESVLGFKDEFVVNEWRLDDPGDILVLCTDGLTEHESSSSEEYVPGRLEDRVRALKDRSAAEIVAAIKEDVLDFARPADDISLVVIKRTPAPHLIG